MAYFSGWSPRSSTKQSLKVYDSVGSEEITSPAKRMLKSLPSMPLLSGSQKMEKPLWRRTSESGNRRPSFEVEQISGSPEPARDVMSASIHPSETAQSSPLAAGFKGGADSGSGIAARPSASLHDADETLLGEDEDGPAGKYMIDAQFDPVISPVHGTHRSLDLGDSRHTEPKLDGISESLLPPPQYVPSVSLLRSHSTHYNPSKRFSTGGIGIQFGARDRRSLELDISNSRSSRSESRGVNSPHISSPRTLEIPPSSFDWARLERNLDRIQALLEQNAAQIRSLEHVQAANWERAVSMLMQNAEQIGELGAGQRRLGSMYDELSRRVVESERKEVDCGHHVRTPPKKLGRRVVGYVYEDGRMR